MTTLSVITIKRASCVTSSRRYDSLNRAAIPPQVAYQKRPLLYCRLIFLPFPNASLILIPHIYSPRIPLVPDLKEGLVVGNSTRVPILQKWPSRIYLNFFQALVKIEINKRAQLFWWKKKTDRADRRRHFIEQIEHPYSGYFCKNLFNEISPTVSFLNIFTPEQLRYRPDQTYLLFTISFSVLLDFKILPLGFKGKSITSIHIPFVHILYYKKAGDYSL